MSVVGKEVELSYGSKLAKPVCELTSFHGIAKDERGNLVALFRSPSPAMHPIASSPHEAGFPEPAYGCTAFTAPQTHRAMMGLADLRCRAETRTEATGQALALQMTAMHHLNLVQRALDDGLIQLWEIPRAPKDRRAAPVLLDEPLPAHLNTRKLKDLIAEDDNPTRFLYQQLASQAARKKGDAAVLELAGKPMVVGRRSRGLNIAAIFPVVGREVIYDYSYPGFGDAAVCGNTVPALVPLADETLFDLPKKPKPMLTLLIGSAAATAMAAPATRGAPSKSSTTVLASGEEQMKAAQPVRTAQMGEPEKPRPGGQRHG